MSSLVDFNVSTPRNRTQSSNECGVVINNTITNDRTPAQLNVGGERGITYGRPSSSSRDPVKRQSVMIDPPYFPPEVMYPPAQPQVAPQVAPQGDIVERSVNVEPTLEDPELTNLRIDNDLYRTIALTLSRILKDNNKKLLANLIDQSGKVVIDITSLCIIISKQLNVPLSYVHIEYVRKDVGCLAKVSHIHAVNDIKINHIDYKMGYNEKYNILRDEYGISLNRVIV